MNIHEYQAQNLFEEFEIPIPRGIVLRAGDEISYSIMTLDFCKICVKAQIYSGGRGRGRFRRDFGHGGVKIVNSREEAVAVAKNMISNVLITEQTGEMGCVVNAVYVTEAIEVENEYYAAIFLDRKLRRPALMISSGGGMEIEAVAENFPEKLHRMVIDPLFGLRSYQIRDIAYRIGLPKDLSNEMVRILLSLYGLFTHKDCLLAEINPLALTKDGRFIALDGKITFDDNALFRHPEIAELRDPDEEDPREAEAVNYGLSYITLDGNIACLVNGAGLAMATMDSIKHHGGSPANFLDIGGGANGKQIARALEIILMDSRVRGILVNIFGGIVKCDVVAGGIVNAVRTTKLSLPLVVRLEGTNVEIGKQLLNESGLEITLATDLDDAARRIVALAK
jgi:succinyl-CoA synthetase beta subunit